MFEVRLNPGAGGPRFAWMRPLAGRDELELGELTPGALTELLARLVVAAPGASLGPGDVANATIADRDRLVAGLYAHAFGDRIESRVACADCERPFEIGFSLAQLLADLDERAVAAARRYPPAAEGYYDLGEGTSFRLPTVADERALQELARDPSGRASGARASGALIDRCVRHEGGEGKALPLAAVEEAMEAVAPLLSLELPVSCALCGHAQAVDFDLLEFLLAALARERPLLVREIHALATAYRWSFAEIVGLSREQRRAQVEVIAYARDGAELGAERGW
jgi:hypothetical protein